MILLLLNTFDLSTYIAYPINIITLCCTKNRILYCRVPTQILEWKFRT